MATGGVESFVAAESTNIHVLDYHDGSLIKIFIGDDRNRLSDVKDGHIGVVTCLAYDNNRAYSGSADETIMVWDILERKRVHVLRGHEGSIVCLSISGPLLISSGADNTVRIWNKQSGDQLLTLFGHIQSVLSIHAGPLWMVTGSADEEVRIWDIVTSSNGTIKIDTVARLTGHMAPVTCVRYGKLEVVSGDKNGQIIIWLVETSEIIRQSKGIHKGAILTLQFDSTRIVSGGADGNVCITDIGTGEVLQTLYGHTEHVLALAFDCSRIISASRDNSLRYWTWGGQRAEVKDKFYVMVKGDTLQKICEQHSVSMEELMSWNGIVSVKDTFLGFRFIVRKADPTQLSEAEIIQDEKKRRIAASIALTKKRLKQTGIEKGSFAKHSRVYKLAMDIDTYSLANRMLKDTKRNGELFPVNEEDAIDARSVAGRMRNMADRARSRTQVSNYVTTEDNVEEWGTVADSLAISMLNIYVEFVAYEVMQEIKRQERDKISIIGRSMLNTEERALLTKTHQSTDDIQRKKDIRNEKGISTAAGYCCPKKQIYKHW